jgi:O-antigen/teichoic acid export membrane protein
MGFDLSSEEPGVLQVYWNRMRRSAMAYGLVGTIIRVGANLILIPLVLLWLAPPEQALWWVFLSLGAFANLADFGFGQVITRVYSYLWAGAEDFEAEGLRAPAKTREPNLARIRQLTGAFRHLYWRLSAAATGLLGLLGGMLVLRPAREAVEPQVILIIWVLYALVLGYHLFASRWLLACQGVNRVREVQIANILGGLTYVVSASVLLVNGVGLAALVLATLLRALVMQEFCRRVFWGVVPPDPGVANAADLSLLRRLWPNARKFGILAVGGYFLTHGNVLVCSHYLGAEVTASFGLTVQVGIFLMNIAALWLAVKWPEITILRTQGRLPEMAAVFARRLALVMGTFLALAALLWLAGDVVLAWKGPQTRLLPAPLLLLYLGYLTQQLFYVQFGTLTFTENVVPFFKISIWTGLGMMVLSVVLTRSYGLWGLLLAPLIAESICSNWYTVRRGFRGQPLSVPQFLRVALGGRI